MSDFIRQQLLYESNDKRLKEIFNEIRKMRTEFHQSLVALRCLEDNASKEYFNEVLTGIENKIDDLKSEMEMMRNGNNDFKESERS